MSVPLAHAIREAATAPETVHTIMAAYLASFTGTPHASQAEDCLATLIVADRNNRMMEDIR